MTTVEIVRPPIELSLNWQSRFWDRVDRSADCWLWLGSTIKGYGQVRVGDLPDGRRVTWYAHRIAWFLDGRPLHRRMTLDHLCRTPACVNPDHMEEVTRGENSRRAHADRPQCSRGHELTRENTITRKSGRRACRECVNRNQRVRWAARKEPKNDRG